MRNSHVIALALHYLLKPRYWRVRYYWNFQYSPITFCFYQLLPVIRPKRPLTRESGRRKSVLHYDRFRLNQIKLWWLCGTYNNISICCWLCLCGCDSSTRPIELEWQRSEGLLIKNGLAVVRRGGDDPQFGPLEKRAFSCGQTKPIYHSPNVKV